MVQLLKSEPLAGRSDALQRPLSERASRCFATAIGGRSFLLLASVLLLAAAGACANAAPTYPALPDKPVALGNGRPKLFEFGMDCKQCRRMKPVMARAGLELGDCLDVHILDIREEENELLAEKYDMDAIPFILLLDDRDNELWRHGGFIDFPQLTEAIATHLDAAPGQPCGGTK